MKRTTPPSSSITLLLRSSPPCAMMASTYKSIVRITKRPIPLYNQVAQLSLMFIALLIMLAMSAVLAMELTLGVH